MSAVTHIDTGLALAEKDCFRIAKLGEKKFDVKPKEDQVKCALYKAFHDAGYLVHVEASYERNGERCDLIASKGKSDVIAIEVKTAWAGVGWVNKPSEQLSTWLADVRKLRALKDNGYVTHGFFVLCFSYQKESKWEGVLRAEISKLNAREFPPVIIEDWNGLTAVQFFVLDAFSD